MRVLIVEDDADLRSALLGTLVEEGYTVEVAPDGREALARLSSGPSPDAILLDLMMPVMNGWQFRARQLALPAFAAIPTIVMTAMTNLQRAAITADDFLPKPIQIDQLRAAIDRCTHRTDNEVPVMRDHPPPDDSPTSAMWRLVAPARGESCRWEDDFGRWVAISLGSDEDLGMSIVQSWHGHRSSFERYEDALRYCRALRD